MKRQAFICIDQTPRSIPAQKGDWAEFEDLSDVGALLNGIGYDRRGFLNEFIPTMMQREMTQEEVHWALDQGRRKPKK